jgi:hypothetical protein
MTMAGASLQSLLDRMPSSGHKNMPLGNQSIAKKSRYAYSFGFSSRSGLGQPPTGRFLEIIFFIAYFQLPSIFRISAVSSARRTRRTKKAASKAKPATSGATIVLHGGVIHQSVAAVLS